VTGLELEVNQATLNLVVSRFNYWVENFGKWT